MTLNKIILLTPNEGLSHQHIEEMKLSGIRCRLFEKDTLQEKNEVLVIDINKLEEQGKVKTVSVDSFEQNNLVLVDEGHKGLSGNVWYDFRSRLSENGFSFEYSATFKQAIKEEKTKSEAEALAHQYGKAIIFDYSYKYFYNDGYGKEYLIYITLFNKERFDEFAELIEGIKEALGKNRRLGKYDDKHLNFRYFDFYNHLYTPLISIDKGIRIEVSPVSLNSDEKLFIDRLKKYCDDNPSAFIEKRLYLLRNKSKVGIGFF
ncbi:hypothetical protein [Zhaonella formicivorans]|uniref:hypothetical protein n=1 Tax=Zhaonella formicivorans TaxID=2528593 RepID=UPI001D11DDC6|nr:hypothetical protein [Zhaonella formicivorans]